MKDLIESVLRKGASTIRDVLDQLADQWILQSAPIGFGIQDILRRNGGAVGKFTVVFGHILKRKGDRENRQQGVAERKGRTPRNLAGRERDCLSQNLGSRPRDDWRGLRSENDWRGRGFGHAQRGGTGARR